MNIWKKFINVRGGYSDTNGISPCNTEMQLHTFDERTRTLLSNEVFRFLKILFEHENEVFNEYNASSLFCEAVLSNAFIETTRLPNDRIYNWIKIFETKFDQVFFKADYNEILDLLWFVGQWIYSHAVNSQTKRIFYTTINSIFEKEYVGYRFVDGRIIAITDKQEMGEIEEACRNPYDGCRSHIKKAVALLADRDKKDYKNCIKESICAVESICQVITQNEKATLGQALKSLKDDGLKIHPALEAAFSKLYGYTSDEGGIRHCEGMFESNVTFEEAKFMLVSCSAFVNYLIAESGKRNA